MKETNSALQSKKKDRLKYSRSGKLLEMRTLTLWLSFCFSMHLSAQPPSIHCAIAAERPGGTRFSSFVEGIDDYLVTLRIDNMPVSVLAGIVPVDYEPYTWEIRIPKLIRQPELAPTCFFDVRTPFLFTCGKGVVNPISNLSCETRPIFREIPLTGFRLSAKSKTTRVLGINNTVVETLKYHWTVEAEVKGKKFTQTFVTSRENCQSELP